MKQKKETLRERFQKYIAASFIVYVVVKVPIMLVFTELGHLHYTISGFIAGAVVTLLNFLPGEFWVWGHKHDSLQEAE